MLSLFCACTMQAQEQKHSTFYYQRATLFEVLPTSKSDIIFLGNSITNGGEWAELLGNPHAKNRGISGDTTQGVLDRLSTITKGKPSKIFLLIGTNDLSRGKSVDEVAFVCLPLMMSRMSSSLMLLNFSTCRRIFSTFSSKAAISSSSPSTRITLSRATMRSFG